MQQKPYHHISQRQILRVLPHRGYANKLPVWLLVSFVITLVAFWKISYTDTLRNIFLKIAGGWGITLFVSLLAYLASMLLGLGLALLRIAPLRIFREIATFYIEIIRGIPMLVLLYYIAFVAAPGVVWFLNLTTGPLRVLELMQEPIHIRFFSFTSRAIFALTIGYSAFIAEIFRAGIEYSRY